jgi:hypothetical protein
MSKGISILFNELNSKEDGERYNAFLTISQMAEEKVEWFYDKFDELLKKTHDENSFQRSIGIMLLCDLSKNDSQKVIRKYINDLLRHIDDEKFITSRQCIQNIWKIAVSDEYTKSIIFDALYVYFEKCENKAHANLLRIDIITSLFKISKYFKSDELYQRIEKLIDSEMDIKNQKKLRKVIEVEKK